MSADNWRTCPQCLMESQHKKDMLVAKAVSEYGKMPREEYLKLTESIKKPIKIDETLREDYEFYIDENNEFTASYSCRCDCCGFKYHFEHAEQLKFNQ